MKNRKNLIVIVSLLAALALFAGCTTAAAAAPLAAAPTEAPALLTLEEAKAIAYAHAGVAESGATDRSCDFDDGAYEIEFDHGGWEYDYRIAPDGTIVKSQKTPEPTRPAPQPAETLPAEQKSAEKKSTEKKSDQSAASGRISAEQALAIALNHAGVSDPRDKDVEWEDGRWEVSFESGRNEYEYKISASGSILRWEKEYDD